MRCRLTSLLVGTALALAPFPAASAQLGGLMKKAQQKAAEKIAEKAVDKAADAGLGPSPQFDEVVLELDATRVAAVLRGLKARREMALKVDLEGKQREAVRTDSVAKVAEEASAKSRSRWEDSNARVTSCLNTVIAERQEAAMKGAEQRMRQMAGRAMTAGGDDAEMKKFIAAQQRMGEAMAKGDEAAAAKAQAEFLAVLGVNVAADSAAAKAKCGPPVPKPDDVERADRLRSAADAAGEAARAAENQVNEAAAKASQMTEPQFGMAFERVETFIKAPKTMPFSATERAALKEKQGELAEFYPK
jgi:hypothetical protein